MVAKLPCGLNTSSSSTAQWMPLFTSCFTASASAATTFLRPRFGEAFLRAVAGRSSARLASSGFASCPGLGSKPGLAYTCANKCHEVRLKRAIPSARYHVVLQLHRRVEKKKCWC